MSAGIIFVKRDNQEAVRKWFADRDAVVAFEPVTPEIAVLVKPVPEPPQAPPGTRVVGQTASAVAWIERPAPVEPEAPPAAPARKARTPRPSEPEYAIVTYREGDPRIGEWYIEHRPPRCLVRERARHARCMRCHVELEISRK